MLKYKYIFRIKYTEAISSNSIGNRYGLKLAKCWLQFKKYKFIVSFVIIFGAYVHSPCASKSGICFKKCVSQSRTSLTLGLHADACFVRAYIACKPRYTAASASHAYLSRINLACRRWSHRVGQKSKLLNLSEYVDKTEKIWGMRTNTNIYRETEALSDVFKWNILRHNV